MRYARRKIYKAKLKSYKTSTKYKYGFEIPTTYKDAKRLGGDNENNRWLEAIATEMAKLKEYKIFIDMGHIKKGGKVPVGFTKIRVHFVFDVKHDGRHRARLVADGHLTDVPEESVYSGVVSLRGLKTVIFLAELKKLKVFSTDISSAYLEAKCSEKVAIIAGPEFGDLQGHVLIVYKALY